jgi:hypothetical protein
MGVLAVEMRAASLFAFGTARGASVVWIARVSNAVDHDGDQFNTGSQHDGLGIIKACARVFKQALQDPNERHTVPALTPMRHAD